MFKTLLVPVDLSDMELAKSALEAAKVFAQTWQADVRLIYVMPNLPVTYMEYVPVDFELSEKTRAEAELKEIAASFALPESRISFGIRRGGVYHEVLAEAGACHADLIVISSHWPTLATYLVGSHATNIVRHASCSVLVVRH